MARTLTQSLVHSTKDRNLLPFSEPNKGKKQKKQNFTFVKDENAENSDSAFFCWLVWWRIIFRLTSEHHRILSCILFRLSFRSFRFILLFLPARQRHNRMFDEWTFSMCCVCERKTSTFGVLEMLSSTEKLYFFFLYNFWGFLMVRGLSVAIWMHQRLMMHSVLLWKRQL